MSSGDSWGGSFKKNLANVACAVYEVNPRSEVACALCRGHKLWVAQKDSRSPGNQPGWPKASLLSRLHIELRPILTRTTAIQIRLKCNSRAGPGFLRTGRKP